MKLYLSLLSVKITLFLLNDRVKAKEINKIKQSSRLIIFEINFPEVYFVLKLLLFNS